MSIKVNSENFESEVLKSKKIVLIDFYADWCGPCQMLSPIVDQVASEHEDLKVVKINVDNEPMLAMQYQVQSIPTLITFKNGQPVNRQLGFMSYEDLEAML